MMDFNITEEELNALKNYKEKNYEAINQMLVSNAETDIALLSEEVENEVVPISYDRENVQKNIEIFFINKSCNKISCLSDNLHFISNLSIV